MPDSKPSAQPTPPPRAANRDPVAVALIVVVGIGLVLRCVFVAHPFDGRSLVEWREADYVQLARNFLREDANPLHPRVDWRGQTSGLAEMELPVLPWIGALLYRVLGYHEEILRGLSALLSCAGLLAFTRLARRLLAPAGALAAVALFAVNPLLFGVAGSIQPEPLMLLLAILAADALLRYADAPLPTRLFVAGAWIGAAILAKSPAAHLGLLTAFLVLRREGRGAFRAGHVYAAAAIALVPPLLWYLHAHSYYEATGLSLGLSNETHLLSLDVLKSPGIPVRGNVTFEGRDVLGWAGALLCVAALLRRGRALEFSCAWYASALVFYGLSADTSGDDWAFYYHSISAAPATLLMGAGVDALRARTSPALRWAAPVLVIAAAGVLSLRCFRVHQHRNHRPSLEALYAACLDFAAAMPADARIAIRGGQRLDVHGHPVAFNASMAFAWADRKGLNYAADDASPATLDELARRGCSYWIAAPADLADADLAALAAPGPARVAESHGHVLIRLPDAR